MRVLAILLAVALAGCFGIPAGSADFGDTVSLRYVALDPESGELLESRLGDVPTSTVDGEVQYHGPSLRNALSARLGTVPASLASLAEGAQVPKVPFDQALAQQGLLMRFALQAQFELGSGQSPLGFPGERELVGMQANETQTFVVEGSEGGYSETRRVDRMVTGGTFEQSVPLNEFRFYFHPDPAPGLEFEYNILHQARVESVENQTVHIRVLAEEGQSAPADFVGATIVTHVDADGFDYELEPQPGARFVIRAPQGQGGTPLGLDPGGYRTRGIEGDQLVYDYTPVLTTLPGRDVRFMVEMVQVETAADAVPTGDYGQRRSPVLPAHHHGEGDDGHGDGHLDHGH